MPHVLDLGAIVGSVVGGLVVMSSTGGGDVVPSGGEVARIDF
ncbi:hypothetical protein [Streptomyces sp. CBG33]|nr:hypothetical protein [Streptomyces sp. CBG33]